MTTGYYDPSATYPHYAIGQVHKAFMSLFKVKYVGEERESTMLWAPFKYVKSLMMTWQEGGRKNHHGPGATYSRYATAKGAIGYPKFRPHSSNSNQFLVLTTDFGVERRILHGVDRL
ncbi:hypothetical protein AVEN_67389-1 [Araneus ventricosus]|uniref:Uncharacterized protein n=1 Tax=Araneus ventricosus TaxID=182803 RepID=A0A4Y2N1Z1_ARAVE|nr:hypothetical protein AVEN_67389-1 [Araneus ventricosus]